MESELGLDVYGALSLTLQCGVGTGRQAQTYVYMSEVEAVDE